MKPFIKRLGVVLLVLAGLYIVLSITPTFGRQIPFNQWAWEHNPFHKVRYFMSDSIIEWLNTEKYHFLQWKWFFQGCRHLS